MKKQINTALALLLVLLTCLSLAYCAPADTEQSDDMSSLPQETSSEASAKPSYSDVVYPITKSSRFIRFIGRMQDVEDGVFCDFTASGIEFTGKMVGDVKLFLTCDRDTYFTVFVDGVRSDSRLFVDNLTKGIVVASFDTLGEHTIKVLKQSEAQVSLSVLNGIELTGELYDAPTKREFLIEFIGDSITSGYGNLGDSSTQDAGSALWSDGTSAYAFLTAEALSADANIISCSGIGIDKGYMDFNEAAFYSKASYYRDNSKEHNDNSNTPDLVVINLGTNDLSCGSTEDAFKAGVSELITSVRTFYNNDELPVLWVYGMMGTARFEWTKSVLQDFNNVYTLSLPQNSQGGNWHPNAEAHVNAAAKLAEFITDNNILSK